MVTTYLALQRALYNSSISGLRHLSGQKFTSSAYCQAVERLPVLFFERLQRAVTDRLFRADRCRAADRWQGHRLFHIDGSSFSMPDTPALQACFGQPGGQAPGCGFPVAHLLVQFAAHNGFLLSTLVAPMRTHDLADAAASHTDLRRGDILVGDRAFCSFAHLALLRQRKLHGVFRGHQRRHYDVGCRERFVGYPKPKQRPSWMSEADFAALPEIVMVREIHVRVRLPGCRVKQIVLVTTLLDAIRYPAKMIAQMYQSRWRAEVNLRHLKLTLGLDVLRSKTVEGVLKELHAFVIIYNLVRRVMRQAARRQNVHHDRISFVDALRWLSRAGSRDPLPDLIVHPHRAGRFEPRVKKRRPKQYAHLPIPRSQLKQRILRQRHAA